VYRGQLKHLDKQTPIICERIIYELNRRIVEPYMTNESHWWMGFKGNSLNNWTPWIVSNVLMVCALCVTGDELREKMTDRALIILDNLETICQHEKRTFVLDVALGVFGYFFWVFWLFF
jgi:hypothetical protein